MNWHDIAFALIGTHSFANLWFWIAFAAAWLMAGRRIIGVPISIVRRAELNDGTAQKDLEDLARINASRLHQFGRRYGIWIVSGTCALLTVLGLTGFYYRVDVAQAMFLVAFPLLLSSSHDLVTAALIDNEGVTGTALRALMRQHRKQIQAVGLVVVPTTVFWGLHKVASMPVISG